MKNFVIFIRPNKIMADRKEVEYSQDRLFCEISLIDENYVNIKVLKKNVYAKCIQFQVLQDLRIKYDEIEEAKVYRSTFPEDNKNIYDLSQNFILGSSRQAIIMKTLNGVLHIPYITLFKIPNGKLLIKSSYNTYFKNCMPMVVNTSFTNEILKAYPSYENDIAADEWLKGNCVV